MNNLNWKVKESEKVLKTALQKWDKSLALAWTGGKDSTVILHMLRRIKKNKLDIPILFIDHTLHFDETYQFVEKIENKWGLNLTKVVPKKAAAKLKKVKDKKKRSETARMGKIEAIEVAINENRWKALVSGIRWDEHEARSNEDYFSKRKNHFRVHPILHFTEDDVWDYINKFSVPYHPLYDKGYRSIGEKEFTKPVEDGDSSERSGREKSKEEVMERLRALGYF